MKITPIMYQILQSRLNIFPNKKSSVQYMSKTCKMLPKWLNSFLPFDRDEATATI